MNRAKVSVLMCVFNSSQFLCLAVDSVLGQTYENIELIIIDDSSTDDSWEIACSYADLDPRIKTIHSPANEGASAALNRGLRIAGGDYITRHDSDDVMLPERLVEQVLYLQNHHEIGAVGTNVIFIDPDGNEIGQSSFPLTNPEIQEALPDYMCFCGPTLLINREAFVKAGYYFVEEYRTAQDYDLCLRLSEVTQMANLPQPLYQYRQHSESVSVAKRHQQLYFKVRSLEQAANRRFGHNPPSQYIDYIARDFLRSAILGCFSNELTSSKRCLEIALRYRPNLLSSETLQPSLEEIIKRYLPEQPLQARVAMVKRLFQDVLPQQEHLDRLRSRLIAELYIVEAFASYRNPERRAIAPELLRKGVQHDPRWLTNRGVVSILMRHSIFGRTPKA
jgi:glycosyltransferase involved in cell wall biosynthesis